MVAECGASFWKVRSRFALALGAGLFLLLYSLFRSSVSLRVAGIRRVPEYAEGLAACDMAWTTHTVGNGSCQVHEFTERLPCAILVGERKTGTSAIVHFLHIVNPRIQVAPSEPHFFDSEVVFRRDRFAEYLRKMPKSCPGDVTIEKTPAYFRLPFSLDRIRSWNKDIKVLVSLRDPIERAVSDFYFELRAISHREAWAFPILDYGNKSFEQLGLNKDGSVMVKFGPLARSLYDVNLQRWLKAFPAKQIHIIDSDLFTHENPAQELSKIEEFLGFEPRVTESMFVLDPDKGFYCPQWGECLEEEKGHHHPKLPHSVYIKLFHFFQPHVVNLHHLTSLNLSWMAKYLNNQPEQS